MQGSFTYEKKKLVIIGVGHVASSVLADAMKLGLLSEIALIDIKEGVAQGEALDQTHASPFTYMANTTVK